MCQPKAVPGARIVLDRRSTEINPDARERTATPCASPAVMRGASTTSFRGRDLGERIATWGRHVPCQPQAMRDKSCRLGAVPPVLEGNIAPGTRTRHTHLATQLATHHARGPQTRTSHTHLPLPTGNRSGGRIVPRTATAHPRSARTQHRPSSFQRPTRPPEHNRAARDQSSVLFL